MVPYFPGYCCIGMHPKLADLALFVSILLKSTSPVRLCAFGAQRCCDTEAICFGAAGPAVDRETGCLRNTVVDVRRTQKSAGGASNSLLRLDTPEATADLIRTKETLGLGGGVLVANPVPSSDEIPAEEIKGFIDQAIAEAGRRGVDGKAVTPFLLSFLFEITGGRGLATNIALIKNNAALATRLAMSIMLPSR